MKPPARTRIPGTGEAVAGSGWQKPTTRPIPAASQAHVQAQAQMIVMDPKRPGLIPRTGQPIIVRAQEDSANAQRAAARPAGPPPPAAPAPSAA